MDRLEQFESPLPHIQSQVDRLVIETSTPFEGTFELRNTSGGEMTGQITSNSRMIQFHPQFFTGNRISITYKVALDQYKTGDVIQTSALVISNGGEITLPVVIRVIPPAIVTDEGVSLVTLQNYLAYVKEYPKQSQALFFSDRFQQWLSNQNYEHMEVYQQLLKESNKERAVDNFLVFNRLKQKSTLHLVREQIHIQVPPFENKMITGEFLLEKSGWGYLEANIIKTAPSDGSWLSFSDTVINSRDFDENNLCRLNYFIDPRKINTKTASESAIIQCGKEYTLTINITFLPPVKISLSSDSFLWTDQGNIWIENNCGKDIMLEILPEDGFIKLEGRQYHIGERARIPFELKMSKFQQAQNFLSRTPVTRSSIIFRTSLDNQIFTQRLYLTVGELPVLDE